jgi:signal transduction histidine kinase
MTCLLFSQIRPVGVLFAEERSASGPDTRFLWGWPTDPYVQPSRIDALLQVSENQMNEIRAELAEKLLDALGQHLAGTVLASGALSVRLGRRKAPEARDAAMLLEMVQGANKQVRYLIMQLNNGTGRE